MSTPDSDDASPSPEYSGDDMAAEQSADRQSGDGSPDQKTANCKSAAANAKDPMRPRRKKARRACFACQRAHLTCGDERPCNRCIKRGLQDHCMDGVRKKAKYLHDAPDGALMPGVGGHYPYMNGNRPAPVPSPDTHTIATSPQSSLFSHFSNSIQTPLPGSKDGQVFNTHQSPISPPFTQAHHGSMQHVPSTMSQSETEQMPQFGPLFDPSDPALFNFDISNLNFGNHYGALEFGMLGHMSSGAVETPHDNGMMSSMSQAASIYNQQMPTSYPDQSNPGVAMSFGPSGLVTGEWQDPSSRQSSMQVQTPINTPGMALLDHNSHRNDSLNGPHAFAIGQGPASHSTASPTSTDQSSYDTDNPLSSATFFANTIRPHAQQSPVFSRPPHENRFTNSALQPIHANGIRKRNRDTAKIYQDITKPYDYVKGYHRLYQLIGRNSKPWVAKAQEYLQNYRPVLLQVREELNTDDLIHQERGLQRNLMTLQDHYAEVGTPFLICRRSGEIVGINKEFTILTGWKREVLLGNEPNHNVNLGTNRDANDSEMSTQNTTPNLTAQDSESSTPNVNIIELMDARSALEFLQHFSELCYQDPRGYASQRVNMLRYQTKADVDRIQEMKANAAADVKPDPIVKMEGGAVHQGESAMQRLGAKNGMVDCMIWWHIKRDIFDMPVLVCMSVMPILDKGLQ